MIPENTDTPQKADCPSAPCSPSSDVRRCGEVTISRNGYIGNLERELGAYRRHHKTGECLKCLLNGWDPEKNGHCPPYPECGRSFPENADVEARRP